MQFHWHLLCLGAEIRRKLARLLFKDIVDDKTKHYIGKSTFAFALSYRNFETFSSENLLFDPTYFEVDMLQMQLIRHSNGTVTDIPQAIQFAAWNDSFPVQNQAVYERNQIQQYIWPTNNDYFLMANFHSEDTYFIDINI